MKAIILAGGLGTRLRPFTEVIPKPLLPIGEKAVLEIQIERLAAHGIKDIYLATNYKSDYIKNFFGTGERYGINFHISKEEKPLGTAGPISLLRDELDDDFIVMNGDILSLVDYTEMLDFAKNKDSLLTIAIKKEIMPFAFGNIFFDGDFVTGIEEKPDFITYILAGIYVMKPAILDIIPSDTYYGMDSLIKDLLKNNMSVAKYELKKYWLDIGRLNDYEKAQDIYNTHFKNNE